MPPEQLNIIMVDQLLRLIMTDVLHAAVLAAVWAPVLYYFFGGRRRR